MMNETELTRRNEALERELARTKRLLRVTERDLQQTSAELEGIRSSRKWQLAEKLSHLIPRKKAPTAPAERPYTGTTVLCDEVLTPLVQPDITPERTGPLSASDYPMLQAPVYEVPKVSIIIPVYNQFEFTYHCVESILENTGNIPYEILIADDCSTDLTAQITEILPGVRHIRNEHNLRFLLNCNNAAKYAKGQYILLLNNDTQVMENWLAPLIYLMESDPQIGMVGSKLIYPDGHLQEAGGIIWNDGTGWNFGNGQNPDLPEFNYVKEADFISGAAIMLPRSLWEALGGFDEDFVPSYCEDSDLAFQVRKAGYKVMYQPQSVVVHFEGVSNGTDTGAGLKQYQVVNREKLLTKWHSDLRLHAQGGQELFLARDRSYLKPAVLLIAPTVSTLSAAGKLAHELVKSGYNVKYLPADFRRPEPHTGLLQQMGVEVLYGEEYRRNWESWLSQFGQAIDLCIITDARLQTPYAQAVKAHTGAKVIVCPEGDLGDFQFS